jgi:uncharacterized protein (DUF1501 family)
MEGKAMHRRDFLKHAGSLALSRPVLASVAAAGSFFSGGRLLAAPQTDARLLVVFLRGGYDSANLLVPYSSDFYYETRPRIAVPRPDSRDDPALALTADWALHPYLEDSLLPLYQKKQLAFVAFAGSDDLSRSHFETQTTLELGQALGDSRDYRSGFLNRLAQELGQDRSRPCAFTSELPLILNGRLDVHNIAMDDAVKGSPFSDRQKAILDAMYRDAALRDKVHEGFAMRQAAADAIRREMQAAGGKAVSATGLAGDLRRVAVLMRERFNLGFVEVGGWDTHVNQGGAYGLLASRMQALGQALAGFAQGMGSAWDSTVVVVVSEFGRTFRENGNGGTDHGRGTVYWVLGGSVRGGQIAGEQVKVAADTLNEDRDFPVLNDYRQVLGGVFQRMYGLDPARLQRVFPGGKPGDLGLV